MDHVSPEMTNHYARLHDKTLRAAWAKARKINAEGSEVQLGDDHPLADTQWLRAGIARAGQEVITVGTSGAVRQLVDGRWVDPSERTWCYVLDGGRWFIGGAINNGGLALDWVRRLCYPEMTPDAGFGQLAADAAAIAPGADGAFVLPYFTGERSPSWTPDAPAMFYGLRLGHGRAHLARAGMEGVAHCIADVWQALPPPAGTGEVTRLTGGITRTPVWAQLLADVLGVPLMALDAADSSATGAALVGLRALGRPVPVDAGASAQAGVLHAPSADHAFYVDHHRAFDALRDLMGAQARVLAQHVPAGAPSANP